MGEGHPNYSTFPRTPPLSPEPGSHSEETLDHTQERTLSHALMDIYIGESCYLMHSTSQEKGRAGPTSRHLQDERAKT